jgi:hypothetical protein
LFNSDGDFEGIKVVKGGASPDDLHGVDAISGGTITSNGVTEMIIRTMKIYEPFFLELRDGKAQVKVEFIEEILPDSTNLVMDSVVLDTAAIAGN